MLWLLLRFLHGLLRGFTRASLLMLLGVEILPVNPHSASTPFLSCYPTTHHAGLASIRSLSLISLLLARDVFPHLKYQTATCRRQYHPRMQVLKARGR